MNWEGLAFQAVDGLASASGLFFVAAGLSLIFGVTRIINIAHGSLYMLGTYIAVTLATAMDGALGFWGGIVAAALIVGVLGALIEIVLLRRIYVAPELFQLLATFALLLVINDAALWLWGPEDLLGPRAPGLRGAIEILGRRMPSYDAFLIVSPVVLLVLHLFARTRFGRAGAGGDRRIARCSARLASISRCCSRRSLPWARCSPGSAARCRSRASRPISASISRYHRRLRRRRHRRHGLDHRRLRRRRAHRRGQGVVHRHRAGQSRRVLGEFFQAHVGRRVSGHGGGADRTPVGPARTPAARRAQRRRAGGAAPPGTRAADAVWAGGLSVLVALPLLTRSSPYALVLGVDVLVAVLFATSLHFIMGPGGMHSFGHAAYFGLGAYGAALLVKWFAVPMGAGARGAPVVARLGALLFGWFAVRLSGVYLAMLTLAFAQIVWSIVFQWEELTGGSNGVLGIWPTPRSTAWRLFPAHARSSPLPACCCCGASCSRRSAMRCAPAAIRRCAPRRSASTCKRVHWLAFAIAGTVCGVAGGIFAFAKGSISPETISIGRSIDGLVMVLLGGIQTLSGPIVGALGVHLLQDFVMRQTEYWHALLGGIILVLVLAFPSGHRRRRRGCLRTPAHLMSELAVASLSKSFGAVRAVDDVSFAVARGEFLALIGPNGAGKSTCFNMINGQLKPDRGTIRFEDRDIAGLPPREIWRRGIGRTFQIAATFSSMTVAENVQMALISHAARNLRAVAASGALIATRALELLRRSAWRKPPTGRAASSPMAT